MKNIKKVLIVAFCILCSFALHAQKENYNWAFGANAGLSWSAPQNYTGTAVFGTTGGNVSLTGIPTNWRSAISTSEGCFSVSSFDGETMFYSDGMTIWNKNNVAMPNGTGLSGDASSAQSGIVIPYPGQGGKFIVFAVSLNKAGGLSYSVVDMSLDGGLGDVVIGQKNIPLTGVGGDFGEALTAVRHANYRDYWVVATARDAANIGTINVWKVDLNGVHTAAASSINTGATYAESWIGYMRFNSDGSKFWQGTGSSVAGSNTAPSGYVLANFNTNTGIFSNLKVKASPFGSSYGAEFSPSGQYIYTTHIGGSANAGVNYTSKLYVWNFDALMSAANISTVVPLKELTYTGLQAPATVINDLASNPIGVPLMGPDDRMYVSNAWTNSMFVIPNPDSNPADLKIYKLNHILDVGADGTGERNSWGLPVYAAMYFNVTLGMPASLCIEKSVTFDLGISGGAGGDALSRITIDWGDGSSLYTLTGPTLSTTYPISHIYEYSGSYVVTMTSYDSNDVRMESSGSTQTVTVSNCRMPVNPHVRSRMEGAGVLINGVYWAKANVDAPGTFASSPESPGMFYQWNRKTPWPVTGAVTGWDTSYSTADSWEPANDPSPEGWRVPTEEELERLYDRSKVSMAAKTINGVNGVEVTDLSTGASLFLPDLGYRSETDGSMETAGRYWSSSKYGDSSPTLAFIVQVFFSRGAMNWGNSHRASGLPIRSVAK
ncbi:FISUMP domain-containing protein [Dysgonomonas macrotermitis]|uniref:Major paralogous domain-containing protein n=1 Tax=Dysgonomonas macrotermitis TaxID=1346286 RepID=A0A1M5E584_9BACT|nr:FISUMP domain-containing protein [Dysgonomonas macrotermitis]SHF74231.1 major paralogous domain-containing protein [Dysgonomonas macrotermitis]